MIFCFYLCFIIDFVLFCFVIVLFCFFILVFADAFCADALSDFFFAEPFFFAHACNFFLL